MAFNAGREFNKFASTQGAGFFGALPKKKQAVELRMAGNALNNLTRYKGALEGIELAEREGSKNRSAARTNAIFGAIGNVAGAGISAGIKNMQTPQVPNYAAESTPVTMGQITSPESWNQTNQALEGLYDGGFSWQSDPFQGQNPYGNITYGNYSINTPGW